MATAPSSSSHGRGLAGRQQHELRERRPQIIFSRRRRTRRQADRARCRPGRASGSALGDAPPARTSGSSLVGCRRPARRSARDRSRGRARPRASLITGPAVGARRRRVQNDGSHPSPRRPTRRSSRRGDAAEPHVERLLHRLGPHGHALEVEAGAVVVDGVLGPEPPHQRRAPRRTAWPAPRARRRTPAARAGRRRRARTPGSSRPPDSRSRVASSLASSTGLRPGSTSTLVPNFSFVVRPAATASATSGSGASPVMRSLSHSESNRSRSSSSTNGPKPSRLVGDGARAEPEADADLHETLSVPSMSGCSEQ